MTTRRDFVKSTVAAGAFGLCSGCLSGTLGSGSRYPGWRPGELDIHLIHTGVGEQTFFIFPDGTTMLLDCGSTSRPDNYVAAIPPKPSAALPAGEWVSRYIGRLVPKKEIDYLMVTHWHEDHYAGIPAVGRDYCFRTFFDHQYPLRRMYASDVNEKTYAEFMNWLASARANGMVEVPFEVGARNQIALRHDETGAYSGLFEVRNIAANGVVWDGLKGVRNCAAEHLKATGQKKLAENMLSAAIRIRYGKFTYFSGGDVEKDFVAADGTTYSYEGLVGLRVGPVDVCKTNHHAYWNAMKPPFVRAVRPQAFISNSWSPNQINDRNLPTMTSRELYAGERTVFFGCVPEEKRRAYAGRDFMKDVASASGHLVVKVPPGGGTFRIFVLTADDESMTVLQSHEWTSGSAQIGG